MCVYKTATLNGVPVKTEAVLPFTFAPGAQKGPSWSPSPLVGHDVTGDSQYLKQIHRPDGFEYQTRIDNRMACE
jgi:hypothetical protein